MTCEIRAGSIYKIPFPFTDLTQAKARPALALTDGDPQRDARFLFITTTPPETSEQAVTIEATDFASEPLPLQCHIRLDKAILLHESLVIKQWARLTDAAMARIYRAIIADEVIVFDRFGNTRQSFILGQSVIPPSGKVIGVEERQLMVEASLDGWLATGRFNTEFEKKLAASIGFKHLITVNSGPSTNLVEFSTLTSPKLADRAIKPGDEVIGVAAGFLTTVNPIFQFRAVRVPVDTNPRTYNIDANKIEVAIGPKTKAIMLAQSLGNLFNLDVVIALYKKYNFWLVKKPAHPAGLLTSN